MQMNIDVQSNIFSGLDYIKKIPKFGMLYLNILKNQFYT
ncbi:MAG: hypothetical protein CLLPBCKN_000697 [Chroococcidiopsis cubana SAG 39.79]|nr:hypothetical protein [Chroococcidiopsis cubana SAG 39.79]